MKCSADLWKEIVAIDGILDNKGIVDLHKDLDPGALIDKGNSSFVAIDGSRGLRRPCEGGVKEVSRPFEIDNPIPEFIPDHVLLWEGSARVAIIPGGFVDLFAPPATHSD